MILNTPPPPPVLAPMTEDAISTKGIEILWNNELEMAIRYLKRMVSAETLLNYLYWKVPFSAHRDDSDKQLSSVISQNDKSIDLFSIKLSKPQRNYTTIEKELNLIVECLQQLCGILFGYEINIYLDHKKLVYIANHNE